MTALAFLLDTKLGHLILALVCMALIGAGAYWRGHNHGWDAATAHYKSVTDACLAANARDAATIAELRAANQAWADAMQENAQKLSKAVEQLKVTQAADAKALADAQAKLHRIEAKHGDVHAWAVTPVPADVLGAVHADGVRQ